MQDDRLRLIFTCCHPALAQPAQVALTLRLLGGLTTPEIARAFLVPEATMAQRITRAKSKIRDAAIPYRLPRDADLPDRLAAVLAVVYLVFTEGHSSDLRRAAGPAGPVRRGHPARPAARRAHARRARSGRPPALMLLSEARRPARTAPDGGLVVLAEQDRGLWNREAHRRGAPGRAGESAPQGSRALPDPGGDQRGPHRRSQRPRDRLAPGCPALRPVADDCAPPPPPPPVVQLNRAVAVAETEGALCRPRPRRGTRPLGLPRVPCRAPTCCADSAGTTRPSAPTRQPPP